MNRLRLSCAALTFAGVCSTAPATVSVPIHVTADETSAFYEYFSNAFARIDLRDPPPNEFRQRMHDIDNPSIGYGAIDVFPHDSAMRFGSLEFDESLLVDGSGTVPITHATLGLRVDPLDPTYENWFRFTLTTNVVGYAGSVSLVDDVITAVNLEADVELVGSILGSTIQGVYPGTLVIDADRFVVAIEGDPVLDTVFTPGGAPIHLEWDWTGAFAGVAAPLPGDANSDLQVTGADYTIWADNFDLWVDGDARWRHGDFNRDGYVTGADYTIWADHFGATAGAAVPEPSAGALAAWALGACCWWARRRSGG